MKKRFLIIALVIGSFVMQAQNVTKTEYKGLTWETDVHKAIEISTKEKKPMMLFFTGSDWCGWCIRLQQEVFQTPEFTAWAKENVILVELDYPKRTAQSEEIKQQNAGMQQAFGVQGYPTVYFATAEIKPNTPPNFRALGQTGYVAGGPSAWLDVANRFLKKK